ncbi:hypothetical protein [Erwinia wuhanensis]
MNGEGRVSQKTREKAEAVSLQKHEPASPPR